MPSPPPTPLDEEAVQRVLSRAVELERSRGSSLTESQVREIAAELLIPDAAIGQALREHWDKTPSRVWRSRLVIVALLGITLVGLTLAAAVSVTVRVPTP